MQPSRFWNKVEQGENCWEWKAAKNREGYGFYRLHSKQSMVQAHRYAWSLENGPIPVGMCVLHHCDNPSCVRPEHLFLGTKLDNAQDRDRKGRLNDRKGENHPSAKLTRADVDNIKLEALIDRAHGSKARIGRKYGVSGQHVSAIVYGKAW